MSDLFLNLIDKYSDRHQGYKKELIEDIQNEANAITSGLNAVNNSGIEAMDKFAARVATLRSKMAEASTMVLDVNSLSGNSNFQFYPSEENIDSTTDIAISNSNLYLESFVTESHQIYDVRIDTTGALGNTSDFNEKRYYNKSTITTRTHVEVESFDTTLSAIIDIDLKTTRVLNMVEFYIKDFGVNNPTISNVEISSDGMTYIRLDSDMEFYDNRVVIVFKDSDAKNIRFSIVQTDGYVTANTKRRYAIGLYNLRAGIRSSSEEGSIVFGPFNSTREILKASIAGTIPVDGYSMDNIKFEISPDKSSWEEITLPYTISEKKKIIQYNNISTDSISTTNPVKTLYLKVTMTGNKVNKEFSYNTIYNRHTQAISALNSTIYTSFDITKDYLVARNKDVSFGDKVTLNSWNDDTSVIDRSLSVMVKKEPMLKTIKHRDEQNGVTVNFAKLKCPVEKSDTFRIIPAADLDVSTAKFFKRSNPIKRYSRVLASSNIVLPFKEVSGVYTITDGINQRRIDLSSGYFESCYQWVFEANNMHTRLVSPTGEALYVWDPEQSINLLDYFTVEDIVTTDKSPVKLSFNRKYPAEELSDKEFSLVDGKIESLYGNAIVSSYIVVESQITAESTFGVNSILYEATDVSLSKHSESLSLYNGKNIAKLNKTCIVRGSLNFNYESASIFPFVEEVDFVDGLSEFNSGSTVEVSIPMNVNKFSLGRYVDKFTGIKFVGHAGTFTNRVYSEDELVSYGDYMLQDVSETETEIVLPEGIMTHDIIITKAVLNVASNSVGNGYFSVDYKNGIIYSQTRIDGNTIVSYEYSNMYVSGKELEIIDPSDYVVSGRQINFSAAEDNTMITILAKQSEVFELDINNSPRLKGLTLNTVVV